jgi:CubicO group peptidase (beta-lactamase class C family)
MRTVVLALVAVAVALGSPACRSAEVRDGSTSTDATLVAAAAEASMTPEVGALDSGSAEGGLASRALPSAERLRLPFRGTKARGFVAMTSTDGAAPIEARRTAVAIGDGGALDLANPVLVASFTKLWTAVATLRMVERGELSLDDTVKDTLPELAARPWASSTIRELLTHTSLVPELDEKGGYYRRVDVDFSYPTTVLAKHVPRDWTEKRGVYKYRNSELALVGAILAQRSKLQAERVLAREVFEPAGMKHAGLLVTTAPRGLDLSPMGAVRPQNFFTAGAGYASASDLLSFFEALAGAALLTDASKALLFDGAAARDRGALGCWAYPFAREDGGATQLVERPGAFGNVRLFSAYFPEEKRAVVAWTGDGIQIARPRAGKGIGFLLARAAIE